MKPTSILLSLLLCTTIAFTQSGSSTFLTWMKGDNTIGQPGMYGTQGISATANKPGARDFSATWTGTNGNLWLFGGYGLDGSSTGYLNDLWKYNSSNNQWTWVKGDNTSGQYGIYGQTGIAHADNKPGSIYASISWTDNNNNLWLFGGFGFSENGFGFLNDLWKYNTTTNMWTWIKGDNAVDQPGVYGVRGVAGSANKPGARYGSVTWTDADGNFWLFGGYGLDSSNANGNLNDLWKYDPLVNKWTWIKGDPTVDQFGIYGEKGISGSANNPGSRSINISWTDATGNFWLYGGYGQGESRAGILNDLWKYNPDVNEWTWIHGDSTINQYGVYGNQGISDTANKPGGRYISLSWADAAGNLWLHGGYGYDASSGGYLNDLWKYDPYANEWTWVKGDNTVDQPGIYGEQGMPSFSNKSGARTSCISWKDASGDLWLFGGYGFGESSAGMLNDLWKISTFRVLPIELLSFSGVKKNNTINLQWKTLQETGLSHFIIQRSLNGGNFSAIGSARSRRNSIGNEYDFSDNDNEMLQAEKVFYRLQLMNDDSSFTYSKILRFDMSQPLAVIQVFPNPAVHSLNISFHQYSDGMAEIYLSDMRGVCVMKHSVNISAGRTSININVSTLPSATYVITLKNSQGSVHQKFIKQ